MRIPLNPFWFIVAVTLVALILIARMSHLRSEKHALTAEYEPGATIRTVSLPTIAVVLAVAAILVPFRIAAAALGGPEIGDGAFGALLTAALIGRALRRRSRT